MQRREWAPELEGLLKKDSQSLIFKLSLSGSVVRWF